MIQHFFKINFKDENALSELLSSNDTNVKEVRDAYVARLKNGESIMAIIAGFPSCALVLKSSLSTKTDENALHDSLIAIPIT